MKYKKITFACVLLGLSLYAGVCAATVREVADEAPASKQTIIADKKDKKLLNKKQRAVQITQEKDKIVVSTKPVAKPPAGTIKVPAAPRPSLLQEKDGKFYFSGTQLPDDYRNIAIYGEAIASKAQAIAYILAANPAVKLACPVEELVELYWQEAKRENVRPDLALAQSLVMCCIIRIISVVSVLSAAVCAVRPLLHRKWACVRISSICWLIRRRSALQPILSIRAMIWRIISAWSAVLSTPGTV